MNIFAEAARLEEQNRPFALAQIVESRVVDGGQVTVELDKEKNALTYGFQSAQKHKPEAAH